jgi:hypothetical protein
MENILKGAQAKIQAGDSFVILEVFKYLNKIGIQLILETILAQSEFLSKTRWIKSLSVDSSQLKNLRIFFWASSGIKRYIMFSIQEKSLAKLYDDSLSANYPQKIVSSDVTLSIQIDVKILNKDGVEQEILQEARDKISGIVLVLFRF